MAGWKEDKVMGQLLRAEIRRESAALTPCADFDPDQASAYIDRALSAVEQKVYEAHLIECNVCRTAVVRLAALDETGFSYGGLKVSPAAVAGGPVRNLGAPVRRPALAAFLRPQWMALAAALVVAAISVPLVLTRLGNKPLHSATPFSAANDSLAVVNPPRAVSGSPVVPGSSADAGNGSAAQPAESDEKLTEKTARSSERGSEPAEPSDKANAEQPVASGSPSGNAVANSPVIADGIETAGRRAAADATTAPASENRAAAPASPSANARGAASNALAKASPSSQPLQQPSTDNKAENKKDDSLPQLDANKALKLTDDSAKTEVSVLRHGAASDESRPQKGKGATIKPEDSMAPTPESTSEEGRSRTRSAIAGGPAKEFVTESKPAEAHVTTDAASIPSRLSKGERKVEGKKFRLINGVWTDKLFNPNKEMPYVTLVRDSDVYKALIAKNADLGAYLNGFGAAERAIIVYKKIVYRLVPTPTGN
ncbi:MAG TPA: zf-HC2 domain-containing protein [Blastocatellia bacterium]